MSGPNKKEVTREQYSEALLKHQDYIYQIAIKGWQIPILHGLITLAADHPSVKKLGWPTKQLITQVRWWCREKFKEWGFSPEEVEYLDKMREEVQAMEPVSMDEHIAEVEISGHNAKVSHIAGQLADNLWKKEDSLAIWLSFDEPVDGILSFVIELPAKAYSRTKFLDLVVKKGEVRLEEFVAKRTRDKEDKAREERRKALENLSLTIEAEVAKR